MTLADHLAASRLIAARLPYTPTTRLYPRTRADVRLFAAHTRAIAAREVVEALEARVAAEEIDEGRRT